MTPNDNRILSQTGMAGIKPDGTYKQKKIPYLLSDSHITEILDQICDNRLATATN